MEKRAKMRPLVCTIAFLLCVAIVYSGISSVIAHSNEQISWIHAYRAKDALRVKKNSLDVIAIGPSSNICGFSPMEAYGEYGFSSFSAGVGHASGFDCYYLLLKEMLKEQHPSVVLIEMSMLFKLPEETGFRVISDAVGVTTEKMLMLKELPEGYLTDSMSSYILPIIKYHTRYKNITSNDFFNTAAQDYYDYFQGFKALHTRKIYADNAYPMAGSSEMAQPNATQFFYMQKVLDLCRSKGAVPVLYKMPCIFNYWEGSQYNAVREYAQKNDLDYIDLNLPDIAQDMNFDVYQDFYNDGHINFSGAVKATQYLSRYLHENFDLPDRRGDPAYAYLDEELERYEREKFNEKFIQTTDLSSYLDLLSEADSGYTAIISAKDEAVSGLSDELREQLKKLGFQSDLTLENAFRHSLIGVWQDGCLVHESLSKGNKNPQKDVLEYRGVLPDGIKYYVKSAGWDVGDTGSIIIDGVETSRNSRGLNIVIYDSRAGRVVDSVAFDTFSDAGISYTR